MKYYSDDDGETCSSEKWWRNYLITRNLPEIKLTEMKREIQSEFFYCLDVMEVGIKGEGTYGKMCDSYKPRNGKNGICKEYRSTYETTDKEIILTNSKYNPMLDLNVDFDDVPF